MFLIQLLPLSCLSRDFAVNLFKKLGRIINRLFEGDRIDYHVVIDGCGQEKPFSMSVPFLPGTDIVDVDTVVNVSFHPQAGVIIKG